MRVVVVGGSAAGQFTSLLLARAGHDVVLVDRDGLTPAVDVESAAASAFRPAAPHIVQPHSVLPRCRLLLREQLPDVYDALLAAGAVEAPLAVSAPPTVPVGEQDGDDSFTSVATRRSTLDLVVRRAVASQSGITVRDHTRVDGLLSAGGSPPRVVGVSAERGDIVADLVVDASGRRTPIDSWLVGVGARPTSLQQAECGLAYHSRHYRLRDDVDLPGHPTTRILLMLDEFTTGIWGSDNRMVLVAIAPLVEDRRFRAVTDADVFTSILSTVPAYAPWLEVMKPITEVHSMGGLNNSMRRLVVDATPVATGLAAVGDSLCTTNPTHGRGLPLALQGAVDLVESIQCCGENGTELAHALDERAAGHVLPFYVDQAYNDGMRLAALRQTVFGAAAPDSVQRADRVSFAELRRVMPYDGMLFRAFWRVMGMLSIPEDVYRDPDVVSRARSVLDSLGDTGGVPQPSRAEIDAVLSMPTLALT